MSRHLDILVILTETGTRVIVETRRERKRGYCIAVYFLNCFNDTVCHGLSLKLPIYWSV